MTQSKSREVLNPDGTPIGGGHYERGDGYTHFNGDDCSKTIEQSNNPKAIDDIRQQIANLPIVGRQLRTNSKHEYLVKEDVEKIVDLMRTQNLALLDQIEKDVIGKDFTVVTEYDKAINGVKRDQRKAIDNIRKEIM